MSGSDLDVPGLLAKLGIKATTTGGGKWTAICPNPAHADSSPSWAIIDRPGKKKHGSHHCQACKWGGGPWELAAAIWGCTPREAGALLRESSPRESPPARYAPTVRIVDLSTRVDNFDYELPKGSVIPGPGGKWFGPALNYLLDRGITRAQIDKWGIGYAIRGRLVNRVIFPVYNGSGDLLTFTARAIHKSTEQRYEQGKGRFGARPRAALYGEPFWKRSIGRLWLVEGTFGALAIERAGAPNPTALLGSEITPERTLALARWPEIVIATDPDKAGNAAADKLQVLSRHSKLWRAPLPKSPDDLTPEEARSIVAESESFFT